ncbi:hypothetical protein AURDEDRAFT_172103 [Auricularia subglabra TFB-10046 SS5]|nr:hypothetical protein AURDEDRAFT_172103 [Auricularia subglabra TFB-10046 SS5]
MAWAASRSKTTARPFGTELVRRRGVVTKILVEENPTAKRAQKVDESAFGPLHTLKGTACVECAMGELSIHAPKQKDRTPRKRTWTRPASRVLWQSSAVRHAPLSIFTTFPGEMDP